MLQVDAIELRHASERVEQAIRSLTDTLTRRPVSDDQVTAQSWEVLRSLAAYKDAALRPENPAVLEWVPPLLEIEAGDRSRDKVIHFATWVFAVTDRTKAVAAGRTRLAGEPDDPMRVESAADAVHVLFDLDMTWPNLREYEQLGLDLEFVEYSSHAMLADDSG